MITSDQIDYVINVIKKISRPKEIFLFGSYAYGQPNDDSDLDIAVIKSEIDDQYNESYNIRKLLFGHGVPMDLIFLEDESYQSRKSVLGTLQYEIAHKGKKLF